MTISLRVFLCLSHTQSLRNLHLQQGYFKFTSVTYTCSAEINYHPLTTYRENLLRIVSLPPVSPLLAMLLVRIGIVIPTGKIRLARARTLNLTPYLACKVSVARASLIPIQQRQAPKRNEGRLLVFLRDEVPQVASQLMEEEDAVQPMLRTLRKTGRCP